MKKISEILAEAKKYGVPIEMKWTNKSMTINGKCIRLRATDLTVWNGNYDKACNYWNSIDAAVQTPEFQAFLEKLNGDLEASGALEKPALLGNYGSDFCNKIHPTHYDTIVEKLGKDMVKLQAWLEQLKTNENLIRTRAVVSELLERKTIDLAVKEETGWKDVEKVA